MRLVITGASGNVGTSVIQAAAADGSIDEIVGIARRVPQGSFPKTTWHGADVTRDELVPLFRGADVVIHLAWVIQPSHDPAALWDVNVHGTRRVLRAVADAGVPAFVYASSVGAYSPGPKDRPVDESWPTEGVASSFYGRHKAITEAAVSEFEREHPEVRVVRLRPGLIFKREAATGIRRLFVGPLLPGFLARPALIPLIPDVPRLAFQAVHSHDVGEAYRLAATRDVRGAFNIAADPVLDVARLAQVLGARRVPVPARALRGLVAASWKLHLQPTPPGWIDLALGVPLLDTTRAREELGWTPRFGADEALLDLLAGLRDGAGAPTPPLDPQTTAPARSGELATGVGSRP